jgi:integrase
MVKLVLSNLEKAYQIGIKQKLLTHNPYEGMSSEIIAKGAKGKKQEEIENDDDLLDKTKAYTWDEVQIILNYIEEKYPHWHSFTKFKFLTGCRTGEAIGFMWCDIEWEKERVLIRRTYDRLTKKFYPLKNDSSYKGELIRKFPMPKNGELWNLLKSIPQGEASEIVFKSKLGKIIDDTNFSLSWRGRKNSNRKGIITRLIETGSISKYLSPYNTRHSFITHAIFDLGIDEKIVSKWCGHDIQISNKHYQDVAIFAERVNPEVKQQSELELLKEQLRQQQEELEEMKKLLQARNN